MTRNYISAVVFYKLRSRDFEISITQQKTNDLCVELKYLNIFSRNQTFTNAYKHEINILSAIIRKLMSDSVISLCCIES